MVVSGIAQSDIAGVIVDSPVIGFQEESDEDLVGLLEESDRKKSGKLRLSAVTHGNSAAATRKQEDDDSDEDLLRV